MGLLINPTPNKRPPASFHMQPIGVQPQPPIRRLRRHFRVRDQQAGRAGLVRAAPEQLQHLRRMPEPSMAVSTPDDWG